MALLNQAPVHFQFVVAGLRGSKAPFTGDLDIFENVDAAGITVAGALVFRLLLSG